MIGKASQWMVMQGKIRRQWSERVILVGPDECQSDKHSLDLNNLPGDSNNEGRLQVRKEVIKHRNILGKSCYHRIKCTAATFLAALMWKRPLNSVINRYRSQKVRKATQQDRYLSARLDDKQVDDGNGLEETI